MKPCPFCASNEINFHYPDEHGHYVCWCGNCGAFGPNDVSEARAREMWNLRRPMDVLLEACDGLLDTIVVMREDSRFTLYSGDLKRIERAQAALAAAQPETEPEPR